MLRPGWVSTGPRSVNLFAVVGMARQERCGAIELLAENDLRQRVRQRERREPQQQRGFLFHRRIESVGAADDERGGLAEQRRELLRRQVLAALIKCDKACSRGYLEERGKIGRAHV